MWVIFLLLFCTVVSADQKVFYADGIQVVDVSGVKTKEEIAVEYNVSGGIQEATLHDGEAYRINNGTLETYNYVLENQERVNQENLEIQNKWDTLQSTMGWTDAQLEFFKNNFNIQPK